MTRPTTFHRPASMRMCALAVAVAACLATLWPAHAAAADSVYWDWAAIPDNSTVADSGISLAALNGGGGQNRPVSGAMVDHPLGVAIDARTGTIYWANFGNTVNYCSGDLHGGDTISFARLDGSGGGTLNTSGATVNGPDGVAIDPVAGRLFWANDHANKISYADLRGGGGRDLNTSGATVNCPAGLVVDPAHGRVYWTNFFGNSISYANLNGSGGGDLPTTGASMSGPYGLAIDSADGRLYWANNTGNSISYAKLDGSGGDDLSAPGATMIGPWGVAIDPSANRIYWANNTGATISYAKLDESGGGDLNTRGAPVDHPKYPALLKAPSATAAPVVGGGTTAGSAITCSAGTWAPDLPESFLSQAPQRFVYRWSVNGTPIAGEASSIIAGSPGRYACQVTASNYAGSATELSAPFTVLSPPLRGISVTSVTLSSLGEITLGVGVPGAGTLSATATFSVTTTRLVGRRPHRHKTTTSRPVLYGTAGQSASGPGTLLLGIGPTGAASKRLRAGHTLKVTLALRFTGTAGTSSHARLHIAVRAR